MAEEAKLGATVAACLLGVSQPESCGLHEVFAAPQAVAVAVAVAVAEVVQWSQGCVLAAWREVECRLCIWLLVGAAPAAPLHEPLQVPVHALVAAASSSQLVSPLDSPGHPVELQLLEIQQCQRRRACIWLPAPCVPRKPPLVLPPRLERVPLLLVASPACSRPEMPLLAARILHIRSWSPLADVECCEA